MIENIAQTDKSLREAIARKLVPKMKDSPHWIENNLSRLAGGPLNHALRRDISPFRRKLRNSGAYREFLKTPAKSSGKVSEQNFDLTRGTRIETGTKINLRKENNQMKHTLKKLAALILAIVMIMSLGTTAFADDDDTTYTITITGASSGHTYTAYQVFSGDLETGDDGETILSNVEWGTDVDGESILDTLKRDETLGMYFKDCKSAAEVAEKLATGPEEGSTWSATQLDAFASVVAANLNESSDTGSGYYTDDSCTISGLSAGYYLVIDTASNSDTGLSEGDAYSRYILQVVGDVSVTVKSDVPTVEKKVEDVNDSSSDENNTAWQDSADYDIGDSVPFKLEATLGDMTGYESYKIVFHDAESEGLTFNSDSVQVTVTVGETEYTLNSSAYTITRENLTDECTFEVTIDNVLSLGLEDSEGNTVTVGQGTKITVTYTSTLDEDAEIGGAGNPNEVYLEYSNNPNVGGTDDTGKTPNDKVIVFTYKLVVNKTDENDEALAGAGFTLYKKDASVTSDPEGKTEGEEYIKVTNDDDTVSYYIAVGEEVRSTDSNTFTWSGIDDGDYLLRETTTPAGYNTMDDLLFSVSAEHETESDDPTLESLTGTVSGDANSGEVTFTNTTENDKTTGLTTTVKNQKGSSLPSTGGMGTKVLYAIGTILVIGAGITLVVKRRMKTED